MGHTPEVGELEVMPNGPYSQTFGRYAKRQGNQLAAVMGFAELPYMMDINIIDR
jgi:hypothetical protein